MSSTGPECDAKQTIKKKNNIKGKQGKGLGLPDICSVESQFFNPGAKKGKAKKETKRQENPFLGDGAGFQLEQQVSVWSIQRDSV